MTHRPDIDAIEARAEKATGSTWRVFELVAGAYEVCADDDYARGGVCVPHNKDNAQFIAHARTDIPALIAYVKELEAKLESGQ